jgi:hypothetical protein
MDDFADEKMRVCDENEEYRDYIVPDVEDDEEEQQKKVKDVDAHDFPLLGRIPNAKKGATERKIPGRSTGTGDALGRRQRRRMKRTQHP